MARASMNISGSAATRPASSPGVCVVIAVDGHVRALFDLKIAPVASYGMQLIWNHLTESHFQLLGFVRTSYLERALGIQRSTRNRLVLLLAGGSLLTEPLRERSALPSTDACQRHIAQWETKLAEVDPAFVDTTVMRAD